MKKIYLFASLFLLYGIFTTSCLKDEGNYDYKELGNFLVDTVGKPVSMTVKQFATLTLPSSLIYDGVKSDLNYRWELYQSSGTLTLGPSYYHTEFNHPYSREDFPDYTIAETENLSIQITDQPGSYYLAFTAQNKKTGYCAFMRYSVTIEGSVGTGIAVLYKGANGIDIDVVATPILNGNLTGASYVRNTYSIANPGRPFAGEPGNLVLASNGNNYYLYLTSSEDAVRLTSFDMKIAHEFEGIFAGNAPAKKDIGGFMINGGNQFFVNDGVVYKTVSSSQWLFTALVMPGDSYYAAPFSEFTYGVNCISYDMTGRRFIFAMMWGAEIIPAVGPAGAAFDLGNIGKDLIFWDKGYYTGTANENPNYCIFKNPTDDGKRYLYVFTAHTASPGSYNVLAPLEITTCAEIQDATFFTFGERGPVAFYATDKRIYQLNYSLTTAITPTSSNVWSCDAAETITAVKLFKQAGLNLASSAQDKYLMVATYNTTTGKGKLYMLEADIASGVLKAEPTAVYDFNGKISDFDFINR